MIEETIQEIEKDITYFNNLGFVNLAQKFERDLKLINSLRKDTTHE